MANYGMFLIDFPLCQQSNVLHVSQLLDALLRAAQTVATLSVLSVHVVALEPPQRIAVALLARAARMEATVPMESMLARTLPFRKVSPVQPASLNSVQFRDFLAPHTSSIGATVQKDSSAEISRSALLVGAS